MPLEGSLLDPWWGLGDGVNVWIVASEAHFIYVVVGGAETKERTTEDTTSIILLTLLS